MRSRGEPLNIRASAGPYIVVWLGVMAVILPGLVLTTSGPSKLWPVLGLAFAFGVGISIWLAAFRLVLSADLISYTTLFGGTVQVAVTGVARIRGEFGGERRPTFALFVECNPCMGRREICVNMKPFGRKNLTRFLTAAEEMGIPVGLDGVVAHRLGRQRDRQK